MEVWDQDVRELALDVRELLITDANLFFIGPDIETYEDSIREVASMLNYTYRPFHFNNLVDATDVVDVLESVFAVPPLTGIQRWSWAIMRHGLVVWIDPDGYKHLDVYERDRIRKLKFPKKKQPFGPGKPPSLMAPGLTPDYEPPGDPIDMWMEADAHVDPHARPDLPVTNLLLATIIEAMLNSPPKWRGWMRQAKVRGTIPANYESPFEVRRSFHSFGISPRLNRLLKA